MADIKQFEAVWGDSFHHPGRKAIGLDFVSDDNGYTPEEREAVDQLEVGQTWRSPDYFDHTIRRIE